jgi:hypothetical protein
LYFEITKANDTSFKTVFLFTVFYTAMTTGAFILSVDPNVVTTAFITKTIFTLIDERVKKKNGENGNNTNNENKKSLF